LLCLSPISFRNKKRPRPGKRGNYRVIQCQGIRPGEKYEVGARHRPKFLERLNGRRLPPKDKLAVAQCQVSHSARARGRASLPGMADKDNTHLCRARFNLGAEAVAQLHPTPWTARGGTVHGILL